MRADDKRAIGDADERAVTQPQGGGWMATLNDAQPYFRDVSGQFHPRRANSINDACVALGGRVVYASERRNAIRLAGSTDAFQSSSSTQL